AADWTVPNMAPDTLDLPGANAWPMTVGTYILLPTNPAADKVEGSRNTMRFFDWAFKNGAQIAGQLEYIPLPESVTSLIRRNWATMVKAPNGAPVWTA
ncbi:MAG: phosphate ABC transporter substrate-binding protein PstS, partial [Roseomonas sp.]|nr:phosphate ABC transporter substrate-binding protein PstS [Roseomonas sp.]